MSSKEVNPPPLALSIAIPTSFIDVSSNKAQKTQQIGRIARAVAIFQVDEIILFCDKQNKRQAKNLQLISQVLEYMETPQYLRKRLFGKRAELRYVGLLPPLRTPHHPLAKKAKKLRIGEIREGVAFYKKGKTVVDVGVESPLPLSKVKPTPLPQRITIQIKRNKSGLLVAKPYSSSRIRQYWGYSVTALESSLSDFLTNTKEYPFIIATSRKGIPIEGQVERIRSQWRKHKRLLLLFGSHKEGLAEILKRYNTDITAVVNHTTNLVFEQGAATIRTEEAVFIGLSTFRFLERRET